MGVDWGQSKRLGGYFTAMIDNGDKEWHWSLIPFILIWVAFGLLLIVGVRGRLDSNITQLT